MDFQNVIVQSIIYDFLEKIEFNFNYQATVIKFRYSEKVKTIWKFLPLYFVISR